ncbi:hypothetical protein PMAYCL1PPCAC_17034, partial [Pristionchus mayeri]
TICSHPQLGIARTNSFSQSEGSSLQFLQMIYTNKAVLVHDLGDGVFHVQLNNPKQLNAMNQTFWDEFPDVFTKLDVDPNCRAIVLSGNGRAFCSGIDLKTLSSSIPMDVEMDTARRSRHMLRWLESVQKSVTLVEKCCKPVIAAIHGFCLGAGVDLIAACDIRYCSKEVEFCVKEVAVGLAADLGSLNRLPKMVGNEGWLRELCYTARKFGLQEALEHGLVSRICDSPEAVVAAAKETAKAIAASSPVAVQGTKLVLNYSRDHTVDESLHYVALWNASQLQTDDVAASAVAVLTKGPKPAYAKL